MDQQYLIMNQCINVLMKSELPAAKQLQLEILLINMKRLWLSEALPVDMMTGEFAVCKLEDLLTKLRIVCEEDCGGQGLARLMDTMQEMLDALESAHPSPSRPAGELANLGSTRPGFH